MGKYTILSNGKRISMFDRDMGVDLSLKNHINKYSVSTIINKVGVFITGNDSKIISVLKQYYEEKKLVGFMGPIVFIKIIEYAKWSNIIDSEMYRIDMRDNIDKADLNDDYLFLMNDITMKINKGFHYAEIACTDTQKFMEFLPYLIRIVEGMIIENHLKLGYFPLHASLVLSNEDEGILIMGNSQSGKSTVAGFLCENQKYQIISDDITFIDQQGKVTPFGQYRKDIFSESVENFSEQIKTESGVIYRRISKIVCDYKAYNVKSIMLPQISYDNEPKCIRIDTLQTIDTITQLLADYPNKWFLFSEYNEVLGYEMVRKLASNVCYILEMKYRMQNTGIIKLWEKVCNI